MLSGIRISRIEKNIRNKKNKKVLDDTEETWYLIEVRKKTKQSALSPQRI